MGAGARGDRPFNEAIDEEVMSQRSGSTRITGSLTRTLQPNLMGLGNDTNFQMEVFLQGISPELRRVVQKITGASSLKKQIAEIVGKQVKNGS